MEDVIPTYQFDNVQFLPIIYLEEYEITLNYFREYYLKTFRKGLELFHSSIINESY